MEKAIVLLSGGMNSAVAAASAASNHELCMLFMNFRQRALEPEERAFRALCGHFQSKHHWRVDLSHFQQLGGNARVDPKRDIEDALQLQHGVAGTFVPMLLPTLLDVAAGFACRIAARTIITGVTEALTDPPPGNRVLYPDNSREFVRQYQYMLESALPERNPITIEAPLLDYDRTEIVRLGNRLNVPFNLTWSCYREGKAPCENCFGCASRTSGFLQAAVPDPLVLQQPSRTS